MSSNPKVITGAAIIAAILLIAGVAILAVVWQIQSTGNIISVGLNVYSDSALTTTIKSIDWGTMVPGDVKGVNIWVQITETETVTLKLETYNWVPENTGTYITIGWNYTGEYLAPGMVKHYLLTCTVSPSITGITNWSNTIFLTATSTTER